MAAFEKMRKSRKSSATYPFKSLELVSDEELESCERFVLEGGLYESIYHVSPFVLTYSSAVGFSNIVSWNLKSSVSDQDPHVFSPPRSGFGSGSVKIKLIEQPI